MTFIQKPPQLGNQYVDDRVLREHPARAERWLTKDFA